MPRRRYVTRPRLAPPVAEPASQRDLLAVREIVHALLRADRPEDVFQFALDRVSPVAGASLASVYLVDGASELMRLVAAHNWPERHRPWLGAMRVRVGVRAERRGRERAAGHRDPRRPRRPGSRRLARRRARARFPRDRRAPAADARVACSGPSRSTSAIAGGIAPGEARTPSHRGRPDGRRGGEGRTHGRDTARRTRRSSRQTRNSSGSMWRWSTRAA